MIKSIMMRLVYYDRYFSLVFVREALLNLSFFFLSQIKMNLFHWYIEKSQCKLHYNVIIYYTKLSVLIYYTCFILFSPYMQHGEWKFNLFIEYPNVTFETGVSSTLKNHSLRFKPIEPYSRDTNVHLAAIKMINYCKRKKLFGRSKNITSLSSYLKEISQRSKEYQETQKIQEELEEDPQWNCLD